MMACTCPRIIRRLTFSSVSLSRTHSYWRGIGRFENLSCGISSLSPPSEWSNSPGQNGHSYTDAGGMTWHRHWRHLHHHHHHHHQSQSCNRDQPASNQSVASYHSSAAHFHDGATIFALSTPPGKSAIAVFRLSGPAALECLRVCLADYVSETDTA